MRKNPAFFPEKRGVHELRLCIDHQSPIGCLILCLVLLFFGGLTLAVTEYASRNSLTVLAASTLLLAGWGIKSSRDSQGRLDLVVKTLSNTLEVPDLGETSEELIRRLGVQEFYKVTKKNWGRRTSLQEKDFRGFRFEPASRPGDEEIPADFVAGYLYLQTSQCEVRISELHSAAQATRMQEWILSNCRWSASPSASPTPERQVPTPTAEAATLSPLGELMDLHGALVKWAKQTEATPEVVFDYHSPREKKLMVFGCVGSMLIPMAGVFAFSSGFSPLSLGLLLLSCLSPLAVYRRSQISDVYVIHFEDRCIYKRSTDRGQVSKTRFLNFADIRSLELRSEYRSPDDGKPYHLYFIDLVTGKDGQIPWAEVSKSKAAAIEVGNKLALNFGVEFHCESVE